MSGIQTKQGTPTATQGPGPAQSTLTAPSIGRPRADYQWPIDQTYTYTAEWRTFSAGTVTLRMEKAGPEHRVLGGADAAGTVALLFHVHDRLESFFDPNTFCSRTLTRSTEEGFRRVNINIAFDYQRRKAILDQKNLKKNESKHEEHDIPSCVTDLLTSIYYVASLPLQVGKTYSFPLNDGGETVPVNVHVEAREQIKVPAGTYNAVRVQPETAVGLLKNKGKMWVWFSDDAAHVPLQMRARMSWGTLSFMLRQIDRK